MRAAICVRNARCTGCWPNAAWSANAAAAATVTASTGCPRLEANGPKQCWTWDITKLAGPTRSVRYFLYTIIDIFSRKVVGWTVAERESKKVARRLITGVARQLDGTTLG